MDISGYPFQGPYSDTSQLEDRSGIYVILDYEHGQRPRVIDVGESAQVKSRVEGHDRKDCWTRNSRGTLKYAVYYTPNVQSAGRRDIEAKIRQQYQPPCGDR